MKNNINFNNNNIKMIYRSKSDIRDFFQKSNFKILSNDLSAQTKLLANLTTFIKGCKKNEQSLNIGFYYPIKNEPDILSLVLNNNDFLHNVKISLPFITSIPNRTMMFKQISNIDDIDYSRHLVAQPKKELKDVLPEIVITPGVCFTMQKNRIGYGMGFYDRFFATNKTIIKIGLCFDQFLIDIEQNNNIIFDLLDVKMDFVITQNGIF